MRRLLGRVARALAPLLAPVLYAGLLVYRLLHRLQLHRRGWVLAMADRAGVLPVVDHYYEPLVLPSGHLVQPLDDIRDLPGLDMDLGAQVALLASFDFESELDVLGQPGNARGVTLDNDSYRAGDVELLYSMIRHLRPRNVIEVGSGFSTRIVATALDRNVQDEGPRSRHICIEPFRSDAARNLGAEVQAQRVEEIDMALFDILGPGDVLFIDSSHVVRPQGDVLHLYQRVLPRLREGVVVHVHDIFTPRDYPEAWVVGQRRLWNEQYLLEAMLAWSPRYRVLLAANNLHHERSESLRAACPLLRLDPESYEPGAFWFVVTDGGR